MARPVWKGHITFGLVNVPVQLFSAQQRTDLQLHMLDSRNHARVRYERVNAETGDEVPWNSIVKGYEYSDGNYVVISEEELKRAAPEATKSIEVEAFVKVSEISPLYFDTPYYIEPTKGGDKGYTLLRRVLAESELVGIARVVIRTRQYMAALMPLKGMLVLELLRYAQEIRPAAAITLPDAKSKAGSVSAAEMKAAKTLVDAMTAEWKPGEYHDEYRDALVKWIDKRVKAGEIEHAPELPPDEDEPPAPLNFMELLKQSVAKAGGGKTVASNATRGTSAKPPADKKPAKKSAPRSVSKSSSKSAKTGAGAGAKKVIRRRKAG